tara:strand:- start:407 stop:1159 length:753 start_codon:yes stop_codon:yes gene_type:complete
MKTVILSGGMGSRISSETIDKPKPMIKIRNVPILVHIMNIYSQFGFDDFILCLGYKGEYIKNYFYNFFINNTDFTIDFKDSSIFFHNKKKLNWKITFVDTGINSNTGERIKRIKKYVKEDNFMLTYGDGVGDVNIKKLLNFHIKHKKLATLTAARPPGRFGVLDIKSNNIVNSFKEKINPKGYINAGFFVLNKQIFKYLDKYKNPIWEREPLEQLAKSNQLVSFKHKGYWRPVDTTRDKEDLEREIIKIL